MLKVVFDTLLIFIAIFLAFSLTVFTTMFVSVSDHEEMWFLLMYIALFLLGVFGIKSLGRYYVKNFL
ncbi:hypothetical protein [Staphylococcus sp. LKG3-3]|uniref:hypothetical protein n=1 Tax=Staphylococcus sp. LKG3-3 TaxID=3399685 RepID=UPI003D5C8B9F